MGRFSEEQIEQVKAKLKERHEAENRKNGKAASTKTNKKTHAHIKPENFVRPPQRSTVATFEPCEDIDVPDKVLSSSEAYKKARAQPHYIMDIVDGPIKQKHRKAKEVEAKIKAIEENEFLTTRERLKLLKDINAEQKAEQAKVDEMSHYGSFAWVKSKQKLLFNSMLSLPTTQTKEVYKSERPFLSPDPAARVDGGYQGLANVREQARIEQKERERKDKWIMLHGDEDKTSSSVTKFFRKRGYESKSDPDTRQEDIAPSILRRYQKQRIFEMVSGDDNPEFVGLDPEMLLKFRRKVSLDDDDDHYLTEECGSQKNSTRFLPSVFHRGAAQCVKTTRHSKPMPRKLQEKHRFEFWKAVTCGDIETIQKLLSLGFNVNDKNGSGRNAVHIAVEGESIISLQYLLNETNIQVELYAPFPRFFPPSWAH
jgi:hypothetical protein